LVRGGLGLSVVMCKADLGVPVFPWTEIIACPVG